MCAVCSLIRKRLYFWVSSLSIRYNDENSLNLIVNLFLDVSLIKVHISFTVLVCLHSYFHLIWSVHFFQYWLFGFSHFHLQLKVCILSMILDFFCLVISSGCICACVSFVHQGLHTVDTCPLCGPTCQLWSTTTLYPLTDHVRHLEDSAKRCGASTRKTARWVQIVTCFRGASTGMTERPPWPLSTFYFL